MEPSPVRRLVDGVRRIGQAIRPRGDDMTPKDAAAGVSWGSGVVPFAEAQLHFLVVGRTGSGKTITIYTLLRDVFREMESVRRGSGTPPLDWRVAIFDAKTDIRSRIRALGFRGEVVMLHPFDRRGMPWDMAADLTAPEEIHHAARLLFPREDGEKNPFFANAAADLLEGVVLSLNKHRPRDWTFRDVICAMESETMLHRVLMLNEEMNASRLGLYFSKQGINRDVKGEVATKLGYYRVVAAYWSRNSRRYSLNDWANGNSVLLIGHSHRGGKAIEAINRVIFYRLSQILLDQENSEDRRSWIVLDELPAAGKLDGLQQLLLKGRSKGASLVLGFQDIAAVEHVYGDKEAEAIIGAPTHRAMFSVNSYRTAKWAEENFFDRQEPIWLSSQSTSMGPQGSSTTEGASQQLVRQPLFLSSEFAMLQPPNEGLGRGLQGVFRSGGQPAERFEVPLARLKELPHTGRVPEDTPDDEKDFLPVQDREAGHLSWWTPAELDTLGLRREQHQEPGAESDVQGGFDELEFR